MPSASEIVHTDITEVTIVFAVLGFLFVGYGQLSYIVKEKMYFSEPLLALILGIIIGPFVLNWVDPRTWADDEIFHEITYQFTRLVLGVQVLFTGIDLPKAYLWKQARSLGVMLLGAMTIAWLTVALLVWGLIRLPASVAPDGIGYSLTFLEALCISAAVTPTDPVLAASITKGSYAEKYVPVNVRNIILAESGANDGLGFPFLYLAIYLLDRSSVDRGTSVGTEIGRWVYAVVIYQVLLSAAYGALLGFIARKTLRWAEHRNWVDKENFDAFGLGLALFTLGTTGLFGSDDIFACFIAGNSFTWDDWYRIRAEESDVQNAVDMLLNVSVFIYIGTILPWNWYHVASTIDGPTMGGIETWRIVVLGMAVLALRRPPWIISATKIIPALHNYKEGIFAGWFGPIGVGAVFYIEVAHREIPEDGSRERLRALYEPVVIFCAFCSILAHGVTIPISRLGPKLVHKTKKTLRRKHTIAAGPTSQSERTMVDGKGNGHSKTASGPSADGQHRSPLGQLTSVFKKRTPQNRESHHGRQDSLAMNSRAFTATSTMTMLDNNAGASGPNGNGIGNGKGLEKVSAALERYHRQGAQASDGADSDAEVETGPGAAVRPVPPALQLPVHSRSMPS